MSKKSERLLFTAAASQHGFFTTAQAEEAGYRDNVHSYHLRNGDWIRVMRGIYRLTQYPDVGRGDLEVVRLWARNRDGVDEGIFSHQTAMELHGRAQPEEKIHITVPTRFRRNSKAPTGVVLHKSDIADKDIEVIEGFRVTGLMRTVADLQEAGEALNIQRPTSDIEHRSTENSDSAGGRQAPAAGKYPGGTGSVPALNIQRPTALVHHSPAGDGGNIEHRSTETSDSTGGRQAPAAGNYPGGTTSVSSGKRDETRQGSSRSDARSRPSVARTKPKPKSKAKSSPEPAREWGGAKIW